MPTKDRRGAMPLLYAILTAAALAASGCAGAPVTCCDVIAHISNAQDLAAARQYCGVK